MGLDPWLDVTVVLSEENYRHALEVIGLALRGLCDYWLIFSFMVYTKFIKLPANGKDYGKYGCGRLWYEERGTGVEEKKKPEPLDREDEVIDDLVKFLKMTGAKLFDQTLAMKGDASLFRLNGRQDGEWSINKRQLEAIRWEDDNDDSELQRALAMSTVEGGPQGENSSDAAIAAQASSKEPSPMREPFQVAETPSSAKSTENMKYKIQQCLHDLIKKFRKSKYKATETINVEPTEAQINSALCCCHSLAFLVQEQLFSSRRRPRRNCRRKTFEQLTREVLGTDNFLPVPLILEAVIVVVAEEFGVTLHEGDVLGGKIDRIREWRFPEKGSDYDVASKEGGGGV